MTSANGDLVASALAAVGERFSMGVVLFDRSLDVLWASPGAVPVVGWDDGELVGRSAFDLLHPDDVERVMVMLEPGLEDPVTAVERPPAARSVEITVRIADRTGRYRTLLVAGRVMDVDGHLVAMVRPGAERSAFDRVLQLLGQGERLDATLDAALDVLRAHFDTTVCLVHAADEQATVCGDVAALAAADAGSLLGTLLERPESSAIQVDASRWLAPVRSRADGSLLGAIVVPVPRSGIPTPYDVAIMDRVTALAALAFERAMYDRRLRRDATTDGLTGVLNRRAFDRRLRELGVGPSNPVVVLFVDIDDFKEINDRHGHVVGDVVLERVAGRLTDSLRRGDIVGRLGGDEFVVACPGLPVDRIADTVERVRAAAEGPVLVDDLAVPVRLSIGAATAVADDDVASLVHRSDVAMYRDKRSRRTARDATAQAGVRSTTEQASGTVAGA